MPASVFLIELLADGFELADWPASSRKTDSMSRVESPRAYISTARSSSACVRWPSCSRIREQKGSVRSATWGAPYSTTPSAVFSRAVRVPFRYPRPGSLPRSE